MTPIKRTPAMLAAVLFSIVAWIGIGAAGAGARAIGAYTTKGAWSFYSAPNLHPPKLQADKKVVSEQLATGGYFLAANFYNLNSPTPMIGQGGPLILNNKLQPVWFDPVKTNLVANNLAAQTYQGKPVLTWWQGVVTNTGGTASGEYVIVDQHYRRIATVTGQDGWVVSLHDFRISGQNAWVTAYKNVSMNLKPYGGLTNGTVIDFAVQEYNLKTGKLLGSWDALHHVPLTGSKQPASAALVGGKPVPWDAYHGNSVQLVGSNELLVSLRNTWAAYLVEINNSNLDGSTTKWTLSGNPGISNFKLPVSAQFHWQHDVQMLSGDRITMFDDACCAVEGPGKFGPNSGSSRGLVLKLNTTSNTGSVVGQYSRATNFDAFFLGSMQLLSNGNALVGWGEQPYFTEFSKAGKTLLDARWPVPDLSYRVLLAKWIGTPYFPPSGAARTSRGKTTVYASWDGATLLTGWRVLAGSSSKHLSVVVKRVTKSSFETAIGVTGSHKWFEVEALGSKDQVLGSSKPFTLKSKSGPTLVGGY